MDGFVTGEADGIARMHAQPIGHRHIHTLDVMVLVEDGDQVGHGVEGPLPLLLRAEDFLLHASVFRGGFPLGGLGSEGLQFDDQLLFGFLVVFRQGIFLEVRRRHN